jgi:hypothetical protein
MLYAHRNLDQVPARHKTLVEQSIGIYCQWLTKANKDPEQEARGYTMPTYKPALFLDTEVNQFADTRVSFCREEPYGKLYMELSAGDGDDGGPSMLYVHAERNWHREKTGKTKKGSYPEYYDVTGYGTEPDGTNTVVRLDPPRIVKFTYEESKQVWEETYTIGFILQEFDTMYSPVYNAEGGIISIS